MLDCIPADDLCMIQNQFAAEVASAADDLHVNSQSFSLGEFNGRTYTYTWFSGMPTILIENVDKSYFPEDALVSDVPDPDNDD